MLRKGGKGEGGRKVGAGAGCAPIPRTEAQHADAIALSPTGNAATSLTTSSLSGYSKDKVGDQPWGSEGGPIPRGRHFPRSG